MRAEHTTETIDGRLAQARAEAERLWPKSDDDTISDRVQIANLHDTFMAGLHWADANPAPRTITRGYLAHVARMLQNLPEDKIAAMIPGLLGIRVEEE